MKTAGLTENFLSNTDAENQSMLESFTNSAGQTFVATSGTSLTSDGIALWTFDTTNYLTFQDARYDNDAGADSNDEEGNSYARDLINPTQTALDNVDAATFVEIDGITYLITGDEDTDDENIAIWRIDDDPDPSSDFHFTLVGQLNSHAGGITTLTTMQSDDGFHLVIGSQTDGLYVMDIVIDPDGTASLTNEDVFSPAGAELNTSDDVSMVDGIFVSASQDDNGVAIITTGLNAEAAGSDTIDGGAGDDLIYGGSFDDDLSGGTGDDRIEGGTGTDTIDGGADDDTIDAGTGDDLIDGGTGNDSIVGDEGADTISGGDGNDQLFGDYNAVAPAGTEYYYAAPGYVSGQNFSVPGGEDFSNSSPFLNILGEPMVVRFRDDDPFMEGDSAVNEKADDPDQLIEINGVEYNYAVDYKIQYSDETDTYTYAVLDVDLNNDGFMKGDIDHGNGEVLIQISPETAAPAGTTLTYVEGSLSGVGSTLNYTTFSDLSTVDMDDSIDGGAGNDTLEGGFGSDTLTGGSGADVFVVDTGGDLITDFDTTTGIQGLDASSNVDNDFVDLSPYYNAITLATWNSDPANTTFDTPLDWMRADQADGVLLGAGGLRIENGGVAVSGADLAFENTGVVCFTLGTLIATQLGPIPVEHLVEGTMIQTMDNGYQPLRLIGSRHIGKEELAQNTKLRPIRIGRAASCHASLNRDLVVSPQDRILVASKIALRMFDEPEILVPANKLLDCDGVTLAHDFKEVTYFHLLFDAHEIVFANGLPAESLHLGKQAQASLSPAGMEEIQSIFPDMKALNATRFLCRPVVDGQQAKKVAYRLLKNHKPIVERL